MSNRIDSRLEALAAEGRCALIPFITTGDPHPDWTVDVMHALVDGGADLIELGVPFSDPTADGPVIQQSSERAIEKGVSLQVVLDTVSEFRRNDQQTPVVLMGYMNPLERFGHEAFARAAAEAGVDGMLTVDCPPEELGDIRTQLELNGVHPITLIAPTTSEDRRTTIAAEAKGYIYYVSFKGITGANRLDESSLKGPLDELRSLARVPLAVGFGIKDAESASAVSGMADGVVIGSALVSSLESAGSAQDAADRARGFVAPIRAAMDNNRP